MKSSLKNLKWLGACIFHIMVFDLPKNIGHLPEYDSVKSIMENQLVHNTVDKVEWENHLSDACKKWPRAANYLQHLAKNKERWGAPWRMEHFTLGYEASSPVEGSFSAFQRALGCIPRSFAGVVQQHIIKDNEKTAEERSRLVKFKILAQDVDLRARRSDAVNACADVFSKKITDEFEESNQAAQNYINVKFDELSDLPEKYHGMGVTNAWSVHRRALLNSTSPPPPRIVVEINGILYCGCLRDVNEGLPCGHIQNVNGGAFAEKQFNTHFLIASEIEVADVADPTVEIVQEMDLDSDCDGADADAVVGCHADTNKVSSKETEGKGKIVQSDVGEVSCGVSSSFIPKKKKPLSSVDKYNNLMAVCKQICAKVSQDKLSSYNKTVNILQFVNSNVQNEGEDEIISAAADYLKVKLPAKRALAPITKRPAGGASTKRKKSCVESASTSSLSSRKCGFCKYKGHQINSCPAARKFGMRLTKSTWHRLEVVSALDEVVSVKDIFPVVPKDAHSLQIVGKASIVAGSSEKSHVAFKVNTILNTLHVKEMSSPLWLLRDTLDQWTSEGKSGARCVFVTE